MITIIHGDDTATSRKYLIEIKNKFPDSVQLTSDQITLTDLMQAIDGSGFFASEKVVILEDLLSKKKSKKELESIVEYIKSKTLEQEIYIWEGKELDKKALNTFSHPSIKQYKLPQTLFLFLDNIIPGNGKELVRIYYQTLKNVEADMIFFMLIRQVRLLLALYDQGNTTIDEVKRLAPWQKDKTIKQARQFSKEKLIQMHTTLYTIDKERKTGANGLPLNLAIDIFLLSI